MKGKARNNIISHLGTIFFILWLLSLATDVLGDYEYQKEFLLTALVLWTVHEGVTSYLKKRKSPPRAAAAALRGMGLRVFGFWVLLLIIKALGGLEGWWDTRTTYALWTAVLLVGASFLVTAATARTPLWRVRSTLYVLGGTTLFLWAVFRYAGMYSSYHDEVFVVGIACIALGFLVGASRKEYDILLLDDVYREIEEQMVEVPTYETSEHVHALTEDVRIGNDARIVVHAGALFVDVFKNAQRRGTVYFGEGTYTLTTSLYTVQETVTGLYYGHGTEWEEALYGQASRRAEHADYERYGLSDADIKELGIIYASNDPKAAEKFEDIATRIRESGKRVTMPFINVIEGTEGDYVRVGPIQITDMKGKGTRVRIGSRVFAERGEDKEEEPSEPAGIAVRIRSPSDNLVVTMNSEGVTASGSTLYYAVTPTAETIEQGTVKYAWDGKKRLLESPFADIVIKADKASFKTEGFKATVRGDYVSASKAERHMEVSSAALANAVSRKIAGHFTPIAKDAFSGRGDTAQRLVERLSSELEW